MSTAERQTNDFANARNAESLSLSLLLSYCFENPYDLHSLSLSQTQGGGLSSTVYVNFLDDHDEVGFTHDKPVLMAHVMKM